MGNLKLFQPMRKAGLPFLCLQHYATTPASNFMKLEGWGGGGGKGGDKGERGHEQMRTQ